MTERTFLVKMNTKKCCRSFIELSISDVCWLENNEGCDGDLNNRPAWCPLIPVIDRGLNLEDVRVWVEE